MFVQWRTAKALTSQLLLEEGEVLGRVLPNMREYLRCMARGARDDRPGSVRAHTLACARAAVRFAKALQELSAACAQVRKTFNEARAADLSAEETDAKLR